MLKKILCIALVLVIVGSAVGFIIYDRVGMTYDYEGKDMSKYLGTTFTTEQIKNMNLDLSKLEAVWREVKSDDKDVSYKIAAAIATALANKDIKNESLDGGTLSLYDNLTFLYYVELADGSVIVSDPNLMNADATSKPSFQLGTDPEVDKDKRYPELSGMLTDKLVGANYDLFTAFRNGQVYDDDVIWVQYTVTEKDAEGKIVSAKTYKFQKTTLAGLDNLKAGDVTLTGLAAAFEAEQQKAIDAAGKNKLPDVIGKEFKSLLTIEDKKLTVDFKVMFASRAIVREGAIQDGDTIFFSYKKKGDKEDPVQLVTSKTETGKNDLTSTFGSDSFYTQLIALELDKNASDHEIKVSTTKDGKTEETTYVVSISYVVPADPTAERAGLIPADPYVKVEGGAISATYPKESEEVKYDATGTKLTDKAELKEQAVKVYLYVVSGTRLDTTKFETYYEKLKFTSTGNEFTDAYLKAANDLRTEEAKDNPDSTKLNTLKTALDNARKAYNTKVKKVDEGTPRDAAAVIIEEYTESQRKAVQLEVNNERAYGVASVVWEALLAEVKKGTVKYPSKAYRLAKEGIIDDRKSAYYANRDKEGYKEYKTFNAYLTNYFTTGDYADYAEAGKNAAIKDAAQQDVLENMLICYLADLYNIELTSDDTAGIDSIRNFYEAYNIEQPSGYYESQRIGLIFDKLMRKIAEDRESNLKIDDLV